MDKFLELFIREPEREFHVREIAKLLKKSPTTISKYLKDYEFRKILTSSKKLNHLLFKANTESMRFKQLKLSYNLNTLNESGLIDYLTEEFNHPKAIILFGSFAKAENNKNSDVDILVVSNLKKQVELGKFRKKIGNEIQIFIHSDKEIQNMKKTNKNLLNSFINGITLYGLFEAFK